MSRKKFGGVGYPLKFTTTINSFSIIIFCFSAIFIVLVSPADLGNSPPTTSGSSKAGAFPSHSGTAPSAGGQSSPTGLILYKMTQGLTFLPNTTNFFLTTGLCHLSISKITQCTFELNQAAKDLVIFALFSRLRSAPTFRSMKKVLLLLGSNPNIKMMSLEDFPDAEFTVHTGVQDLNSEIDRENTKKP
ncbi:hypothetical protein M9H77_09661 [Catharanthus roseus]|uniref:Uncharacterized protein n=1 Tax=Catharanthus roseus TaxID=4058 RepID=A0ACC0C1E0_CATRO|nr:hypothetical protein M9H77_09661 [Catharanthus roseus]